MNAPIATLDPRREWTTPRVIESQIDDTEKAASPYEGNATGVGTVGPS